jgi:hypothetical protein
MLNMSPVVNTTVMKTTIKVEPNLDKKDLQPGNKSDFGDLDVIVISSDSESDSESKPRVTVKKEDIRIRLKEPIVRAKGKARNRAMSVANRDANASAAFDRGSFIQESGTVWTDSDITSFVIEGDLQVTAELWVKRVEYLSEIPYIFPIPKVATAFIVDLQDEKFLVPKSESDSTLRKPDALIKSKVGSLATGTKILLIDDKICRIRTVGRVGVDPQILPPAFVFKQGMNALCAAGLGYSAKDAMRVQRLTQSFLMSRAMN